MDLLFWLKMLGCIGLVVWLWKSNDPGRKPHQLIRWLKNIAILIVIPFVLFGVVYALSDLLVGIAILMDPGRG